MFIIKRFIHDPDGLVCRLMCRALDWSQHQQGDDGYSPKLSRNKNTFYADTEHEFCLQVDGTLIKVGNHSRPFQVVY